MQENWHILQPIRLGPIVCRNRLLMGAHSYGYVDEAGLPTDFLVDYIAERAKGGVGLVIMGGTSISKEGALVEHICLNISDKIVPWYRKIAEATHQYGALVFDQLTHVGGQLDSYEGSVVMAPSSIHHETCNALPLELSTHEIGNIVVAFADAAYRAKQGGLDGVELKGDQGFLIHQFLSPYYNRRTDPYGGTYEKRLRFLLEIIESVREAVGNDFVVGVRITGDSTLPGDLTIDDAVRIAVDIERSRRVDFLDVNGGTNSTYPGYLVAHGDASVVPMNFATLARRIKGVVKLPVFATSMVTHPSEAEYLVSSGAADMVAMTRSHICDAEIVRKTIENRLEDIRPCVLCNQGCVGNHWKGLDIRCIYNAATGRERELGIGTIVTAPDRLRVTVIGGGPAGLEAARVAALRGHEVELYEKERELGGQLLLASKLPYKQGLLDIVRYLEHQIRKLGVEVHRGVEVSAQDIVQSSSDFDVVILATGATPYIPPVYEDVDPTAVLTISDVLDAKHKLSEHVLVVSIDWRQNALSLAEWLVQRGSKVTVTTPSFFAGEGLDVVTLTSCYSRLDGHVEFIPLTALVSLNERMARLRHVLSNRIIEVTPVDQVVFVTGATPSASLFAELAGRPNRIVRVGDCVMPRGIAEAILDANRLARKL